MRLAFVKATSIGVPSMRMGVSGSFCWSSRSGWFVPGARAVRSVGRGGASANCKRCRLDSNRFFWSPRGPNARVGTAVGASRPPPFAPAYVTYTHRLRALIEDLRSVLTVADLAAVTGLSGDTVKNIIPKRLEKDYGRPRLRDLQPLSIDEIYLGRRKWFGTLVMDLDPGRIVWAAQGRGANALRKFWPARRSSRAKIEAVAMDMSAAYWAAVAENLPTAAIVFDRFHTTKPANEKLDDLRRERVREATGLMKQTGKGVRYLLLLRRDNVEEEKLPRLDEALKHNEPLFTGYLLKEALGSLWEPPSYAKRNAFLHEWCDLAARSGIRQMMQWAKTLLSHKSGIRSWWKHRINNGRMEGINNKIKTLLRQTYGLRDARYFVLRLHSLHHSRQELFG